MNILLKYFIYFLLGIIIYYFLFNSTDSKSHKLIEGFGNLNDVNNKAIYFKNSTFDVNNQCGSINPVTFTVPTLNSPNYSDNFTYKITEAYKTGCDEELPGISISDNITGDHTKPSLQFFDELITDDDSSSGDSSSTNQVNGDPITTTTNLASGVNLDMGSIMPDTMGDYTIEILRFNVGTDQQGADQQDGYLVFIVKNDQVDSPDPDKVYMLYKKSLVIGDINGGNDKFYLNTQGALTANQQVALYNSVVDDSENFVITITNQEYCIFKFDITSLGDLIEVNGFSSNNYSITGNPQTLYFGINTTDSTKRIKSLISLTPDNSIIFSDFVTINYISQEINYILYSYLKKELITHETVVDAENVQSKAELIFAVIMGSSSTSGSGDGKIHFGDRFQGCLGYQCPEHHYISAIKSEEGNFWTCSVDGSGSNPCTPDTCCETATCSKWLQTHGATCATIDGGQGVHPSAVQKRSPDDCKPTEGYGTLQACSFLSCCDYVSDGALHTIYLYLLKFASRTGRQHPIQTSIHGEDIRNFIYYSLVDFNKISETFAPANKLTEEGYGPSGLNDGCSDTSKCYNRGFYSDFKTQLDTLLTATGSGINMALTINEDALRGLVKTGDADPNIFHSGINLSVDVTSATWPAEGTTEHHDYEDTVERFNRTTHYLDSTETDQNTTINEVTHSDLLKMLILLDYNGETPDRDEILFEGINPLDAALHAQSGHGVSTQININTFQSML